MNIIRFGEKYKIESSSSGKFWIVDPKKPSCNCPHFLFRLQKHGGECKHIMEVRQYLERNKDSDYQAIIAHIQKHEACDAMELIEKFGEDVIDEMERMGLIVEEKGKIRLLE